MFLTALYIISLTTGVITAQGGIPHTADTTTGVTPIKQYYFTSKDRSGEIRGKILPALKDRQR